MTKTVDKIEYISMFEAAKLTPYAQDYLSLLCRRNILKSKKVGRKWYTTTEWLNEYMKNVRPESLISKQDISNKAQKTNEKQIRKRIFDRGLLLRPLVFWFLSIAGIVILVIGVYSIIVKRVDKIEASSGSFETNQITKVPNENGGYDVYGEGKIKIGQEENVNGENSLYLGP